MGENSEHIWIVHWKGPLTYEDAKKENEHRGYVLYQLYGYHNLYGFNSLLYIGQTTAGIKTRLGQHGDWVGEECDQIKVRLGSISKFTGWKNWENGKNEMPYGYPEKNPDIIKPIEDLLIFSNQPVYNGANKSDAKNSTGLRIFNAGQYGSIFPEVSSWYFLNT